VSTQDALRHMADPTLLNLVRQSIVLPGQDMKIKDLVRTAKLFRLDPVKLFNAVRDWL
jgi:hypothetical protein